MAITHYALAGIYKTREAAEKDVLLWVDVFPEETIKIEFDGYHYKLMLPVEDEIIPVEAIRHGYH